MAMTHTHHAPHQHARKRRVGHRAACCGCRLSIFVAGVIAAGSWVTYILWPRWPAADIAIDAPTLPITVNGVNFNIPPTAIRNKMQRKPGTQERVDLVFLWPSLTPPDPAVKAGPVIVGESDRPGVRDHRRFRQHPAAARALQHHLSALSGTEHRDHAGCPDAQAVPRRYALSGRRHHLQRPQSRTLHGPLHARQCDGLAPSACACYERRIEQADITARFPRAWLSEWQTVSEGLDKLIRQIVGAQLRAS